MPIGRADWSKDTSWTEYHLTPSGWVRGTQRSEGGKFELEIAAPPDTLMTIRSFSCIPSNGNEKPRNWSEIRWATRDTTKLQTAQADWGVLPLVWPLSPDELTRHRSLPGIDLMGLDYDQRPRGRRQRRGRFWWRPPIGP